jgi:ribonuclease BN (tRNA processing enzyme)
LQRAIQEQMADPYFPVDMTEMAAHCNFYDMDEERLPFDDCTVQSMWLNHPQGCLGFRLETANGIFVYATDNEPGNAIFDRSVRKLAEGADILIYDAQYLPSEYHAKRMGWGHSHWREAVDIALESGAKELVLYHHDPDHDDQCVDAIVKAASEYYPRVRAAREGDIIEL